MSHHHPSRLSTSISTSTSSASLSNEHTIHGSSHTIIERRRGEIPPEHQSNETGPLTVFARHMLNPGAESQFKAWVREITHLMQTQFPGFLGAEIVRPTCNCDSNEYVSIFRFDNYAHLQTWMDSKERQAMLEKTQTFEQEPLLTSYHSLEYWFVSGEENAAAGPVKPPSREKMAFVTFLVIWLQAHYIPPNIGKIPGIPSLLAEAMSIFIIVLLTTYVIMPIVTKYILRWWLFPDPNKRFYFFSKETETQDNFVDKEVESSEIKVELPSV
jgi:antibiotic biosynthesis monooxygenase (ABM) superfamily enzyme